MEAVTEMEAGASFHCHKVMKKEMDRRKCTKYKLFSNICAHVNQSVADYLVFVCAHDREIGNILAILQSVSVFIS